jgi:ABC-type arginine/histidine transport system permease subunit
MTAFQDLEGQENTNNLIQAVIIEKKLQSYYPKCLVTFNAILVTLTTAIALPIHMFEMQSRNRDLTMQMLDSISGFGIVTVFYMMFTTALSLLLSKTAPRVAICFYNLYSSLIFLSKIS